MSSLMAQKMVPYLSYFLYAQLILVCLLVLIAAGLILKRLKSRGQLTGEASIDNARIASEINSEISRLRDLRNRILPGLEDAGAGAGIAPAPGPAAEGSTSTVYVEDAAMRAALESKIQALEKKLANTEQQLKAAANGAEVVASGTQGQEEEMKALQEQIQSWEKKYQSLEEEAASLKKKASAPAASPGSADQEVVTLKTKVSQLESALTEYELFEEEFSLVKQYKAEIETLKQALEEAQKGIASAPSTERATEAVPQAGPVLAPPTVSAPPVEAQPIQAAQMEESIEASKEVPSSEASSESILTNEDIDKLFADLDNGGVITQGASDSVTAEPVPTAAATNISSEAQLSDTVQNMSAPTSAPAPAAIQPAPLSLEDLAEAAVEDDLLVNEFEKLLGPKT